MIIPTALLLAGRHPKIATTVSRFSLVLVVIKPAANRLREMPKYRNVRSISYFFYVLRYPFLPLYFAVENIRKSCI